MGAGYPYHAAGVYGYGHGVAAAGYANVSPSASTSIAGLAPAAVPALAGGYAGAGRDVANSAGVVHVAKREAEADPGFLYGGYGTGSVGAALGIAGYAPAAVPGLYGGYAGAGRYVANSGGIVHVAKREADADPGYLYGHGIIGLGSSVGIAGYAPAAVPGILGGYAGAGRYVANSAGVVHVA